MMIKDPLGLLILIIAIIITILLRAFLINLSKTPLIRVEFEESDKDIVTVWLDLGGMVVKSDKDNEYWKEQIVIDPDKLNVGGQMVIYNLSKDAVRRSNYLVLNVKKEK
jgi:vancomycin permeability regulator SanA